MATVLASAAAPPAPGFYERVDRFRRDLIVATLREHGGNRTYAARALGLRRTRLLRLMRDLGIHEPPPARWTFTVRAFTDDQAREMRRRRRAGETLRRIASDFGTSYQTAWNIVAGEHYRHVSDAEPPARSFTGGEQT